MLVKEISVLTGLVLVLTCCFGSTHAKRNFRIIDGRIAKAFEFPYQVAIENFFSHWCGGSIVTEVFVISAAHCVMNSHTLSPVPEDVMRIRVGTDIAERGGVVHTIESILMHENYGENKDIDEYDISVLKVERPFSFTNQVQPVALASQEPADNSMAWVTGYGHTKIMRRNSNDKYLMAVEIPIMNRRQCQNIHKAYDNVVTNNMICAGYGYGHKDACKGDSGGPIVVDNMLVGVVAWGQGCGQEGIPGVYTSIAKYRSWIDMAFRKL